MTTNYRRVASGWIRDIDPAELPATLEQVVTGSTILFEAFVVNPTGSPVVLWIKDANDICLAPGVNIPAGGTWSFNSAKGRSMPGGIWWSGAGLHGSLTFWQ